jgi:predicted metal-dependent hydrolase
MKWSAAIFSSLILILILLIYYWDNLIHGVKYSAYNTKSVAPCQNCEEYQVHRAHDGGKEAAKLLSEINSRNSTLLKHLEGKYIKYPSAPQLDPTKSNRIDVIPGTEMYDSIDGHDIVDLLKNPMNKEYLQERISQLLNNYDSKYIYEISPKNTDNATSYTEDKKILVLCLRHKKPDTQGKYNLHDINTMMFVVLHELTHMANKSWGHPPDFWILFKFLLLNAIEAGIYNAVDYGKHPINYCGLWLHYNPIFDDKI